MPMEEVVKAHTMMEKNEQVGKIVLTMEWFVCSTNMQEVQDFSLLDDELNGLVGDAVEQVLPLRSIQQQHITVLTHFQGTVHVTMTDRSSGVQSTGDQSLVHRHAHENAGELHSD